MKIKTVNYRDIWNCTTRRVEGGFVLEFSTDKYLVCLHFKRWWIGHIAETLWQIIKSEEKEIKSLKDSLRGEG